LEQLIITPEVGISQLNRVPLRRVLLILSVVLTVGALLFFLNFTATNPTGRRYSSQMPILQGSPNDIGASAEIILADDLGVPKNNANFDGVIPDFITEGYMGESKNCADLPCEYRGQFEKLLTLAADSGRPLWIYTRVDTRIPADMMAQVAATGGAIIPYFTVPGYVDPLDQWAWASLLVGIGVSSFFGAWELVIFTRQGGSLKTWVQKEEMMAKFNQNRLLLLGVVIILGAVLINIGPFRSLLANIETIAAIIFYTLGALWFFKQL